jgi:hypothetical protein
VAAQGLEEARGEEPGANVGKGLGRPRPVCETSSMLRWRLPAVILLLLAAACTAPDAGPAAPWPRPANLAPWFMSGVTADADSIAYSLSEDVHEIGTDRCPFLVATCDDANRASAAAVFEVEQVSCRQEGEYEEVCAFDLFEQVAARGRARSRCRAHFQIVGTSHDPSRWAVDDDEYSRPRMRCRRLSWRPPAAAPGGGGDG